MMEFNWWVILQGIILFILAHTAKASEGEADRFAEHCRTAISFSGPEAPYPTMALNIGHCFGLMDGIRGANYYLKKAKSEMAFCEPSEVKNDDLAKTFVVAIDNNPHLKELRGAHAAIVALHHAFPCKDAK